ncbi:MAG: hypothetical protein V4662_04175 [Verrucomicrobiota bacterium]
MAIPPRYRKWIKLALLAALLGYAVPRLWMSFWFVGRLPLNVQDDFAIVASILPKAGSSPARFHLGLPHAGHQPGKFLKELWLAPFANFHGHPFHFSTWAPPADFQEIVARTLTDPAAFIPYGGPKLCGGYHADLAVRFESSDGPIDLLLCFGCGDVLIYSPHGSRITYMSPGFEVLEDAWGKLNGWPPRPPTKPLQP